MPITSCAVAVETTTGGQPQGTDTTAVYLVFALVAVVLGFVVLTFIRANARRSSKR